MIFPFMQHTPRVLRRYKEKMMAWALVEGGKIFGVYKDFFVLAREESEDEPYQCAWADILHAAWDSPSRTFTIHFMDDTAEPLTIALREGASEAVVPLVRDRVDSSFYWRSHSVLPSGCGVTAMIRVAPGGELVPRMIFDGTVQPEDTSAVADLEVTMRDIAGLDAASSVKRRSLQR